MGDSPPLAGWNETAGAVQPAPFPARSGSASARGSVSIRLSEGGKPDLDAMRPATAERLKEILQDPDFQKRFGIGPVAAEGITIDPAFISSALDMLGGLQAQIVAVKYKIPYQSALSIFAYTKPEKDMLTPPAQRVLGKRAPEWVAKYGDEITLAVMLVQTARAKFAFAAQLGAKIKAESETEQAPEKSNGEVKPEQVTAAEQNLPGVETVI